MFGLERARGGFKPNRDLLNVNFQGYKLSERQLEVAGQTELPCPVAVARLREDEFSYQYTRAHALHNHLHFDPSGGASSSSSVYWCGKDGFIKKTVMEAGGTISLYDVLSLPTTSLKRATNVTMAFLSDSMGVVCAGGNEIALFRRDVLIGCEEKWIVLETFAVSEDKPVMLVTASLTETGTRADILCAELVKSSSSTAKPDSKGNEGLVVATYKWIRVRFKINPSLVQAGPSDVDGFEELGSFRSKSLALYTAFQRRSSTQQEQLLFVSETAPLAESDEPERRVEPVVTEQDTSLLPEPEGHCGLGYKREDYEWTQTETDITLSFQLPQDVGKRDVSCVLETEEIAVGLTDGTTFLSGELVHSIDPQASTWTIQDHVLEVSLEKRVEGVMWGSVVKAPERTAASGPFSEELEERLSPEEMEKAKKLLAELAGKGEDLESSPSKRACPTGAVQSMLEECDTSDEDAVLYVISQHCSIKQQVGLGGRQLVFTGPSPAHQPNYLALRHDVDGVVWQPRPHDHTPWTHVSTFHALGYVQASKRERKFTTCSPRLEYAVICDGTRHIFVYMCPRAESPDTAVEYVYSTPKPGDILGLVATDEGLIYVLTDKELILLRIPDFDSSES